MGVGGFIDLKVGEAKTVVNLIVGEKKYPMRKPKIGEARKLEEQIAVAPKKFDVIAKFLEALGLPSEVLDELNMEDMETLLTELTRTEQKKS